MVKYCGNAGVETEVESLKTESVASLEQEAGHE